MKSQRALAAVVLLAVLVVVAAGTSGAARLPGPRWVPHFKIRGHAPAVHTVPVAKLPVAPRSPPQHGAGASAGPVVLWVIVGIAVVALAVLLWRWWGRRPAPAAPARYSAVLDAAREVPIEPEPDTPALRTGIELALRSLDEQRDPADAVVRAWLGLQETAEESGIGRRAAETPTEFTSRVLSRAFADAGAIRTLLRLYLRTRFGDHPVTAEDVADVRAALAELVRTWPVSESPAGARSR